MKKVSDLLELTVNKFPDSLAIVFGDERLSYLKLKLMADRFTAFFLNSGFDYKDKVAVFLPNSPLFVISFFALNKIGAIAVTLNINYKEEELRNYLKASKVKYIITDKQNQDKCVKASRDASVKCLILDYGTDKNNNLPIKLSGIGAKIKPPDEALRQFSSGSTGKPKIVGRNHCNLLEEAKSVSETIKVSPQDKILCVVPLFHAYGFGSAMTPSIYAGATLVLIDKFNPRKVLKILKEEKITIFFAVPYMFGMLADYSKNKIKLPRLKYCFSAGISLPQEISQNFYHKFGVFVRDLYGSTETGCISINLNRCVEETFNSVGLAISGTEIEIILDNGQKAGAGQKGQIVVKTPTCGSRYYSGDNKKLLLRNGYFYSGDLGKKDQEGNLYILGRTTSFINVAGEKVDPVEVENVLKKHAEVKEAVVLGYSDKLRGEAVRAVIVPQDNFSDKNLLLKYCRERLADFKIPRLIEFRDTLPKNALGKVLKGCL